MSYSKQLYKRRTILASDLFAAPKDTFDVCDVCERKVFQALAYIEYDVANELYKLYTANEISTNVHFGHATWPVVLKDPIQRFSTKTLVQKHHSFVTEPLD